MSTNWFQTPEHSETELSHFKAHFNKLLTEYYYSQEIWYGDGAGNTVEENSSIFSLIWMH